MQVHDPLQVPHIYKQDVCQYRDTQRYFYSAMVSALDHSVDLVVQSLKQNNMYDNTIIVFTTDNDSKVDTAKPRLYGAPLYGKIFSCGG